MSKHLLYLIGQPGAGKSTLAAALTEGLEPLSIEGKPFAHTVWGSPVPVVELGIRRDSFSGTDALSMSVQPKVVGWLEEEGPDLVFGEGDRLANSKFFHAALMADYEVLVARLGVSSAVADARRASRVAALGGKPQSPSWLAGRITKASRLANEWEDLLIDLDADQPVERVLAQLVAAGGPVARALHSGREPA